MNKENAPSTIEILGHTFFYEVFCEVSEYGESYETVFYNKIGTRMRKKYYFFGPMVEVPDNKVAFSVQFNILDDSMTKDELRTILERRVELLGRRAEIEKGELV